MYLPSANVNTKGINIMVNTQEHRLQCESVTSNLFSPNRKLVNLNKGLGRQQRINFRFFKFPIKYMLEMSVQLQCPSFTSVM